MLKQLKIKKKRQWNIIISYLCFVFSYLMHNFQDFLNFYLKSCKK